MKKKLLRELGSVNILSTGCMTKTALEVSDRLKEENAQIGVIDAYKLPLAQSAFIDTIKDTKKLVTLEEHTLAGGLGSHICEMLMDANVNVAVKRVGFDFSRNYCYAYGGRETVHPIYGMDAESLGNLIKELS